MRFAASSFCSLGDDDGRPALPDLLVKERRSTDRPLRHQQHSDVVMMGLLPVERMSRRAASAGAPGDYLWVSFYPLLTALTHQVQPL